MSTDQPVEHIAREPLPWRDSLLTECGLAPSGGRTILTGTEYDAKVRKQGEQRAALSTCMTCWTARDRNSATWLDSPDDVILRYATAARTMRGGNPRAEAAQFNAELKAIAAVVAAHRDQFEGFLADLAASTDLTARRRNRRGARNA